MFENYSPAMLRKAVEIELQSNKDPKTAAIIAMKRLEENPEYYTVNYGVLEKARKMPIGTVSKGRKKIAEGKWVEVKGESNFDKIKLKMRFDAHSLISNFEYIGYSERRGKQETSIKSLSRAEIAEKNFPEDGLEHTVIIDASGKTILAKTGNGEEIDFNKEEYDAIRNSEILTHNHTKDLSFSAEDIFLGLSLGIKELRVKTPGNVYFFKINQKKGLDDISTQLKNRRFMSILIEINQEVTMIQRRKVSLGELTPSQAEKQHREIVWDSISNNPILIELFDIEYGMIRK